MSWATAVINTDGMVISDLVEVEGEKAEVKSEK
jgi:hypothetical protein